MLFDSERSERGTRRRFETSSSVDRAVAVVILVGALAVAHLFGVDKELLHAVTTAL